MNKFERRLEPKMAPPMGGGRHGGRGPAEKAKDFKGTLSKTLKFLGKYKIAIIFVFVAAIISTIFSIVGPKIMGNAISELFSGLVGKVSGGAGIDFDLIAKYLLMALFIYGVSALFNWIQGWAMAGISQKVSYEFRKAISEKIHRLPLQYFETKTTGDVLSRITNDVDTLGASLNQSLTQFITSVTTIVGVVIMMLTISPLMTLITLFILPISVLLMSFVIKRSQKYFVAQQNYLGKVNGQVEEVYGGQMVVKAFNREKEALAEFDQDNDKLYESAFKSQFLSGLMQPIMQFVGNLGYVAVVISGAYLATVGTIQVGDIQAFIQYIKNFTQPIQQFAQIMNQIQSMMAAAERIFNFLDAEEEEDKESDHEFTGEGEVDFEHVRFGYDPEKIIIKDWSANIKPGQTVAIVGPTGAGKTTMVKLLMRFYELNGGRILVDGEDIKDIERIKLRKYFGMVLQDTWLFKGSIMENIRYGKLEASDEEVREAAKAAHADSFIRALPGGYNMELNEETDNISQGQKQLITIARAILADKPILILDEATSSVDTRTESLIQKAMNNLMAGRTSFVIAHRLSTIKDADVIIVMKDGDIIEQGNHNELLASGGFYASLYNSQFEEV